MADHASDHPILVAAGILVRDGKVLICQRHHGDPYGLQWEFPGGKVEAGEDLAASLARELNEELAIEAKAGEEVFHVRHCYPDRYVEVVFFLVREYEGEIQNRVFERVEWASRGQLCDYRFLDADRELVERLANGGIFR